VALVAAVLLVSGCSDDEPVARPLAEPTPSVAPTYDASIEPAAAVLALVPEDARTLTVTDFGQVRKELGVDGLTGASAPGEVAAFWHRAEAERPLLTSGMLRPSDQRLLREYGFTELDVVWEAHFFDAQGQEAGWVLRLSDGVDMARVRAGAQDPATPISGGEVNAGDHLVSSGTAADPDHSWAADAAMWDLVGLPANATYVSRDCVPADGADVDELTAYSVQFEGSLVTARLGAARQDLFARMRLGEEDAAFDAAFDGGAADPLTGRIGYVMTDPAAAARLALEGALPFAACP
jgi:hypothetical protein